MQYISPFQSLLDVKMTCSMMYFCGWTLQIGESKPEFQKELDLFMDSFEFKTQKNSDIAKSLISLIQQNKVIVRRPLNENENELIYSRVKEIFKYNKQPSEYEIQKEADFQWQLEFDWKTVLIPISEGFFDK